MPIAYFSEVNYAGVPPNEFAEVAALAGTDVTGWSVQIYNQLGSWLYSVPFPAPSTTVAGKDVYTFYENLSADTSLAIVDASGNTLQFISFYDPPVTTVSGDLAGQTPAFVGVTAAKGESVQSDDRGATYYVQTAPNPGTIPCFAPGMMVACPGGPRPVETLQPGDLVTTRDHGAQPVRWVDRRPQVFTPADFSDRPILIPTGTLGALHRLIVSPQHRMLIGVASLPEPQVLVPAKALIGHWGIRAMRGVRTITWHHFALPRHELVCVNGAWTESLLLGPMLLGGLSRNRRQELLSLFPTPAGPALNGPPARTCLRPGQARRLLPARRSAAIAPADAPACALPPCPAPRPVASSRPWISP